MLDGKLPSPVQAIYIYSIYILRRLRNKLYNLCTGINHLDVSTKGEVTGVPRQNHPGSGKCP